MQCAGCKRPRCTLGPHLFKLTAASTRRWNYSGISLSEGICWPWQCMKYSLSRLLGGNRGARTNTPPNPCWSQHSGKMQKRPPPTHPHTHPHPKSVQSLANSFPIFTPLSASSHLENGVTFTTLAEKCCQRLSQSAEKFQRVSRRNPTLVNSKWYISNIAATEGLKTTF